ncbi:MAG: polyprenyl synthetase family protein [Candidatus Cyclobacteriaceae bacterium M2_1C_046]
MIDSIKKLTDLLNSKLESERFGADPEELYEPIRYILSIGGKRMRPLLTLLGYKLYKDDVLKAVDPAMAIEIFHNFTLMHDDIMDQAPLRRGKSTVHEKWNMHTAILSGDVMMIKAYDKLLDLPATILPDTLKKFNNCAVAVCEGQQKDMIFETRSNVSEEEYLDMIRQKTAVLLGFALELGAIVAETNSANQKHLRQFGESIGIGFQLKDDLLDVYGDEDKFGKQSGGDIISNKKTYLLIKALELSEGKDKKNLEEWLAKKEFDNQEKLQAIKELYTKAGVEEITNQKIQDFYKKALRHLNDVTAPLNRKKQLKELATLLIDREV